MKFICGFFRNHLAVSGMKVLTAPSEPFGPGQSDQTDLYAGDGDQHVGTGGQGCSGGQYVIDQHDMLVLQGGQSFIGQGKQVFCVEPPFVAVLVGLGRIMVNAVQGIRADGDAGKGRDSSGQQFADAWGGGERGSGSLSLRRIRKDGVRMPAVPPSGCRPSVRRGISCHAGGKRFCFPGHNSRVKRHAGLETVPRSCVPFRCRGCSECGYRAVRSGSRYTESLL